MKDMPSCLGSGPRTTGTATGIGTAEVAAKCEKREKAEKNADTLMINKKVVTVSYVEELRKSLVNEYSVTCASNW